MPAKNKRSVYFRNPDVWDQIENLALQEQRSVNFILERAAKAEILKHAYEPAKRNNSK